MVTELKGGGDVEGLIEREHRLPLEATIGFARETFQGPELAELAHGQGIVHRT